jgi:hypothetical protein
VSIGKFLSLLVFSPSSGTWPADPGLVRNLNTFAALPGVWGAMGCKGCCSGGSASMSANTRPTAETNDNRADNLGATERRETKQPSGPLSGSQPCALAC